MGPRKNVPREGKIRMIGREDAFLDTEVLLEHRLATFDLSEGEQRGRYVVPDAKDAAVFGGERAL